MTGLLAFYPLDGSAEDHSGNGRNANARGGAPANDRLGIADGSFALDGIDDYVELPKDIRPKSVSVSLWFRAGRPPHWSTLLRQRYFGFGLALDESGKLLASVFTTPSENTYYRLESSSVVADGAWHHAVMTYGLAGFVLYIDGRKQGVPRTDLGLGPIYYADFITKPGGKRAGVGGAAFTLGQEKNMAHLDGALDDVGIWDRQITDNEVLQLYQSR